MSAIARFTLPLLPLVFASCQTAPVEAPLRALADNPVACDGGVSRVGLPPLGAVDVAETVDGPRDLHVRLRVFSVDADLAPGLVGDAWPGVVSWVVDTGGALVSLAVRPGDVTELHDESVALADGQRAFLEHTSEVHFVAGYDLIGVHRAAALEPRIDPGTVGHRLLLTPRYDEANGPWSVEARLQMAEVDDIHETEIVPFLNHAPGGVPFRVWLESPVFFQLSIATRADLEPGQSLLVVGPDLGDEDRIRVALLTPQPSRGHPLSE